MFSSIIVALQSFVEEKPLRISTENLIGDEVDEETSNDIFNSVFTIDFIKLFLLELQQLEQIIYKKEGRLDKNGSLKIQLSTACLLHLALTFISKIPMLKKLRIKR